MSMIVTKAFEARLREEIAKFPVCTEQAPSPGDMSLHTDAVFHHYSPTPSRILAEFYLCPWCKKIYEMG